MIDVDSEKLLTFKQAAAHPAFSSARTGRAAHLSQLYRWIAKGARGANGERVLLEVIRTPSGMRTSREAIARFLAALNDQDRPTLSPRNRAKQIATAERELAEAGFGRRRSRQPVGK